MPAVNKPKCDSVEVNETLDAEIENLTCVDHNAKKENSNGKVDEPIVKIIP